MLRILPLEAAVAVALTQPVAAGKFDGQAFAAAMIAVISIVGGLILLVRKLISLSLQSAEGQLSSLMRTQEQMASTLTEALTRAANAEGQTGALSKMLHEATLELGRVTHALQACEERDAQKGRRLEEHTAQLAAAAVEREEMRRTITHIANRTPNPPIITDARTKEENQ